MERLLEHEIFAAVLGETVDLDHLNKISVHNGKGYGSYSDCDEFIISQVDYCEDPDLSKLFKITDSIKKRWKENSIDFRIYLYLNDMDGDFLDDNDYSREEVLEGMKDLASDWGVTGLETF